MSKKKLARKRHRSQATSTTPKKLRRPCKNCPFRRDKSFHGLDSDRAEEFVHQFAQGLGFHCHKTTKATSLHVSVVTDNSVPCVGAIGFLQHAFPGGAMGNLWFALGHELGQPGFRLDDIDPKAQVCRSPKEFFQHAVNPMLDDPRSAAFINLLTEIMARQLTKKAE